MKTFVFMGQKLLLLSSVPALAIFILLWAPLQQSNAELISARTGQYYTGSQEELENMRVYQQGAPAVVSVNSERNQGAGVILTPDGLIVTNKHVIQGSSVVNIRVADGSGYKAQLVSLGTINKDLAFLRILSKRTYPYVRLGDSSTVRVGQRVLAIGSPFGLDGTLTTGIVSRIDKQRNMIQTDAAINPGNSGGPLFNTRGDLIGINRSIINPVGASSAGISFAVPVNVVKQELANNGVATVALAPVYSH